MATVTRRRKTTDERRAQIAALRDRLAEFEAITEAGLIAQYLAQFDGYSPRNAKLIAMQCPDATEVRGFRAWLEAGRCVRKGETGIQILAPMPDREDEKRVQEAHERGEETDEKRMRFRLAYVFDISQTGELVTP